MAFFPLLLPLLHLLLLLPPSSQVVDRAGQADVVVIGVGEVNYAEGYGNILDLAIPKGQEELVVAMAATGVPVVVVLLQGRPRLLGE